MIIACTDKTFEDNTDYLRSPSEFRIYPVPADTSSPAKFIMSWRNPQEKNGFQGHTIYLDTTNWEQILKDGEKAKVKLFIHSNKDDRDSIIFSLGADIPQSVDSQGLYLGTPYYILDSVNTLDTTDSEFHFALVSKYSGDGPGGQQRFTNLIVDDQFKPEPLFLQIDFTDQSVYFSWLRPKDPTSFFDFTADTGIISGYSLSIRDIPDPDDAEFTPLYIDSIVYYIHGISTVYSHTPNQPSTHIDNLILSRDDTTAKPVHYRLFLPDGRRHHTSMDSNRISLELFGFIPRQKYQFQLYAVDSSGNAGFSDAELITIITTDTTKPLIPTVLLDSVGKNQFSLKWVASRDTRLNDSLYDQNIRAYHILRVQSSSGVSAAIKDTIKYIINIGESKEHVYYDKQSFIYLPNTVLTDTAWYKVMFHFLPPGVQYNVFIWAIDSTNHRSDTAFISVTTKADTLFRCREGFVPISGDSDFCIEAYEHQDSTGDFENNVTLPMAIDICRSLSLPSDSVYLCTDIEWVRACNGNRNEFVHKFGIQSITTDSILKNIASQTSVLQRYCNQGAEDSAMANHIELRNPQCVTNEGVFDMSGNFSEWVSYTNNPIQFHGGNYKKPPLGITEIQEQALCSIAVKPMQIRPQYIDSCISHTRNITAIYKNRSGIDSAYFCPTFSQDISRFKVDHDTVSIFVYFSNGDSSAIALPGANQDSLSKKPSFITLNDTSLLVITIKPYNIHGTTADTQSYTDTLDYREFKFSSYPLKADSLPSQHPIFLRELNPNLTAYPTQKLFGYIIDPIDNKAVPKKPAKGYYSNKVVGFRCCSQPIK